MPRINFEETVWADIRFAVLFAELIKRFQDLETTIVRQLAAGALLSAWRVAQQYYTDKADPGSPIPLAIWIKSGLCDQLITADFAEPVEGGIRMKGSEEAFEWIIERREAGRRGGKRNKKEHDGKKSNDEVKQNESKTKQNEASYSYSYSSSSSSSNTNTNTNTVAEAVASLPVATAPAPRKTKTPKAPTEGTDVWNAYRESMQAAWGIDPPRSARTASQAAQLVVLVGAEKAKALASYYPRIATKFYRARGHPFGQLLTDYQAMLIELNRIAIAPATEVANEEFFRAVEETKPTPIKMQRKGIS